MPEIPHAVEIWIFVALAVMVILFLISGMARIYRKAGPHEAFYRAVTRNWPRLHPLLDDPLVCARGYMNAGRLRTAMERVRHGCESRGFPILQTICLEFWLRALENRRSTATNNTALDGRVTRLGAGESCSHERGPLTPCPMGHGIPSVQAHP